MVARIKRSFQRSVAKRILSMEVPNAEMRIRSKLARWKLDGVPAHVARRVLGRLQSLRSSVTPRVLAAVWSTLWNRWATARRFQRRHDATNRCLLGCAGDAEDSIEHYANCAAVRAVAARYLRLPHPERLGLQDFLLADAGLAEDAILVCTSILVYATFSAMNKFRHSGRTTFEVATDALVQFCKMATEGHSASAKVLDSRWILSDGDGLRSSRRRRRAISDPPRSTRGRPSAVASGGSTSSGFHSGGRLVTGAHWLG